MHGKEWVALQGQAFAGIRAQGMRERLGRKLGQCTWCGEKTPPQRSLWCSDACWHDFKAHCWNRAQMPPARGSFYHFRIPALGSLLEYCGKFHFFVGDRIVIETPNEVVLIESSGEQQ